MLYNFMSCNFKYSNGFFELKGNLFLTPHEKKQIINIIKNYIQQPNSHTHFHFKIHYLDDKNAELFISEIYSLLQPLSNLRIYWEYNLGDEGGQEMGMELQEELQIPFIVQEIEF